MSVPWPLDELANAGRENLDAAHVRDEHSTFTWLLEPMLEHAGFTIEAATYSADGMFAEYLARAQSARDRPQNITVMNVVEGRKPTRE